MQAAEHVRDRGVSHTVLPELTALRWSTEKSRPTLPAEKFIEGARAYRERFRQDGIGVFDAPYLPLNPRTSQGRRDGPMDRVGRRARRVAGRVRLGRARGAEGPLARRASSGGGVPARAQRLAARRRSTAATAYNGVGAALAERGFVMFAPHNLYRGEDRYRWLDRKANTIRATLFSFILGQHDRILDWLGSLPFVDPGASGSTA